MIVLLTAFTLFNLIAAAASLGGAARLLTAEERAHWRSKRLLLIAALLAWSFPLAALGGTALAWRHYQAGQHDSLPLILGPLLWLIVMGAVFAVVDFLDDGVIGNARARRPEA